MSKQEEALQRWSEQQDAVEVQEQLDKIQYMVSVANDPMNSVGQAQAGIQLARVSVPWLLNYIEELEGKVNGTQELGLQSRSA